MQTYDPNKLIISVQEILRGVDIDAQIVDTSLAVTGACMLLRGLGAVPAMDAVEAYKRILDNGPWPDLDDRRAAEFALQNAQAEPATPSE